MRRAILRSQVETQTLGTAKNVSMNQGNFFSTAEGTGQHDSSISEDRPREPPSTSKSTLNTTAPSPPACACRLEQGRDSCGSTHHLVRNGKHCFEGKNALRSIQTDNDSLISHCAFLSCAIHCSRYERVTQVSSHMAPQYNAANGPQYPSSGGVPQAGGAMLEVLGQASQVRVSASWILNEGCIVVITDFERSSPSKEELSEASVMWA